MIVDFLYLIVGMILTMVQALFELVNFVIPDSFTDSLVYIFGYLNYLRPFFPVDTLFNVLSVMITFYTAFYSIKIIIWLKSHMPFIGGNPQQIKGSKTSH